MLIWLLFPLRSPIRSSKVLRVRGMGCLLCAGALVAARPVFTLRKPIAQPPIIRLQSFHSLNFYDSGRIILGDWPSRPRGQPNHRKQGGQDAAWVPQPKARAHLYIASQCRAAKALPLDSGRGFRAPCTLGLRRPAPRPLANRPPVGSRQRRAALDRQSGSLAPRHPSVGTSASRHPRPALPRRTRTRHSVARSQTAGAGDAWRNSASPPPSSRRSAGQSVVAAAAYRAGEKLLDERTGDIKDYSRRGGVLNTLILTPENASQWMLDRQRLWNEIEHREDQSTRRKQAQLARSLELSLPHELTHEQHVELLRDYFKTEYVALGMIADIAIHAPPERGDGTNHHAHVLLTMRDIEGDGFGAKNRDWNQKALIEHWRERWAEYQNRALEKYGFEDARRPSQP